MPRPNPKKREAKPLWTCPRCQRQFKNRNQSHSCGQFTVEQHIHGKPQDVVEMFNQLCELILRCGQVEVAPTKTRVHFKIRSVFATVAVKKNGLELAFVLDRYVKHRRIHKALKEYPGIVHLLRIEKAADLDDDLADWLQESYDYRQRKDSS
jgi:hypothetical protein